MKSKIADTKIQINELISRRWSPRIFDPEKKVTNEQLLKICEAARWAPSCANEQPYKYIIWNRFTNEVDFMKAFETLDDWNQKWVKNCPILMVALADKQFSNGDFNRWAEYDTGSASENICLQATDLGLFAHQMGGFDQKAISVKFDIPPRYVPMAMIAIGHKSWDFSLVYEKHQKTEVADRTRKPLSNNFFNSKWNNPLFE
jgi:nitroreductase